MALNPRITDWQGQRIWIVGASSGIGEALARALGARGARLGLSARRREALEQVAAHCGAPSTLVLPLDITDAAALATAWDTLSASWGGVDLVIVMAGDYVPLSAARFDLPTARKLIDVNLQGPLNVLDTLLPAISAGARTGIALVSSVAGYRGLPRSLVY